MFEWLLNSLPSMLTHDDDLMEMTKEKEDCQRCTKDLSHELKRSSDSHDKHHIKRDRKTARSLETSS
jgi:hypothetical protein